MKTRHIILAGALLAAPPAFAVVAQQDAADRLPPESTQGTVHYVSGGIGRDESMAFRNAEHRYPLALEFAVKAKPRDEYTAGVKVQIRDAKGHTVLDTVSDGPFLLAQLPQGRYEIRATQAGKTLERHADVVDRKPRHVGFVWPAQ